MIRFTIPGEPATKKTGQRIVRARGRPCVVPSQRTRDWTRGARWVMQRAMQGQLLLTGPVRVVYHFYRKKNVADLGGLEAALDDALQGVVLVNDRQILVRHSWRLVDTQNPRVEAEVEELTP